MNDWDELEKEFGGKNYAPAGKYTVKVESVDHHIVGDKGSIAQDFFFEEKDGMKFPKATHWLSTKNVKWRRFHNRNLMMLLGASKETAQKAVDVCETKSGNKATLINAYQAMYDKLIAKAPEVEIEVWQDGKYSRGEFTDGSVRMSRPDDAKPEKTDSADEILEDAEEINLDQENLEILF